MSFSGRIPHWDNELSTKMLSRLTIYFQLLSKDARLPIIIMAIFALLIIYSLWQMLAAFKINDHEINAVNTKITVPMVADISQQHLFGQFDENLADLPTTQLQLTLQGIAMGLVDSEGSRALISTPSQPAKVYKIGERVPGGATIRQILRDRVILDDNGRFESLNLPVPQTVGTITEAH